MVDEREGRREGRVGEERREERRGGRRMGGGGNRVLHDGNVLHRLTWEGVAMSRFHSVSKVCGLGIDKEHDIKPHLLKGE